MKKYLIIALIGLCLSACNKNDDDQNNNNPYLVSPLVNLNLNLNLPEYSSLKFPGNSVIVNSQGIKGIVVYNVNNELYTAFDLTDPNHVPNSCSRMTIEGIVATCPCSDDNNAYDIVTGQRVDVQLVSNGSFNSTLFWEIGENMEISEEDNLLKIINSNNEFLSQSISLRAGRTYEIKYTISDYSSGGFGFKNGDNNSEIINQNNGTYTETFTLNSNMSQLRFQTYESFTGNIDNISIKEIYPNNFPMQQYFAERIGDNVRISN